VNGKRSGRLLKVRLPQKPLLKVLKLAQLSV
jgi:hypothetical protein